MSIAPALAKLRAQFNERFPSRNKSSDGWIGDAAHQGRVSDHNPDSRGIVCALDITHDPAHGVDIARISRELAASGDARIKYLIANREIWSPGSRRWEPYSGANPHTVHIHISVTRDGSTDGSPWRLACFGGSGGGVGRSVASAGGGVNLARGSSGARVRELQRVMAAWYPRELGGLALDGVFGAGTERAVRLVQQRNGLAVDGIAGRATLGRLGLV